MDCFQCSKKNQPEDPPYGLEGTTSNDSDWYQDMYCNYSKRPTMLEKVQGRTSMTQEIRPWEKNRAPVEKLPTFLPRDVLHPIYPQLSKFV